MAVNKAWEKIIRDRGLLSSEPLGVKIDESSTFSFVILPMPPSANNLFPTSRSGHRYQSKEYKAWIALATPIMERLKPPTLPTRYKYTILRKMRSNADGENLSKAAIDLAVSCGIIPDDSIKYVIGGSWEYDPDKKIDGIMLEFL